MRYRYRSLLTALIGMLLLWPAAAVSEKLGLSPFAATYQLKKGSMLFGEVRVKLSFTPPGTYHYHALTIPVGLAAVLRSDQVTEQSNGRIGKCGITPEHYLYQHQKSSRPRQRIGSINALFPKVDRYQRH